MITLSDLLLHNLMWVLHLDHAGLMLLAHSISQKHRAKHTVPILIAHCIIHVSNFLFDVVIRI